MGGGLEWEGGESGLTINQEDEELLQEVQEVFPNYKSQRRSNCNSSSSVSLI